MTEGPDTKSEERTVTLTEDTVEKVEQYASVDDLDAGVAEMVSRAALYDQLDYDMERAAAFAERVDSDVTTGIWSIFISISLSILAGVFAYKSDTPILTAIPALFAVILLVIAARTYRGQLKLKSDLNDHFHELGIIRPWEDYSVLTETESVEEVADGLAQLRRKGAIGANEEENGAETDTESNPGSDQTPESNEGGESDEINEIPHLWVDEQAYKKINTMREDGIINDGDFADAVFREVRLSNARKQGPFIEMDHDEMWDLVNQLNTRADGGTFVCQDGPGVRKRLDYQTY